MSEAKIRYEDVVDAIHVLEDRGEPINPFRLRVVLGRGGYKTIEKHLLNYQAPQRLAQPPSPPLAKIANLSASIWDSALVEARAELEAERQQLFALLEEREKHVAEVEQSHRQEAQQRAIAERVLAEKEGEGRRLLALLEEERRQRDSAERRFDLAQSDLRELSQRVAESLHLVTESQQRATRHVERLLDSHREWTELGFGKLSEQLQQYQSKLRNDFNQHVDDVIRPLDEKLEVSQAQSTAFATMLESLRHRIEQISGRLHQQQARDRKARPVSRRKGNGAR